MKKKLLLLFCFLLICLCAGMFYNKIKEVKNTKSEQLTNTEKCAAIIDNIYEKNQSNVMFSPLSLNMALGLVGEGATDTVKEDISTFLGHDDYREFAKQYLDELKEKEQTEKEKAETMKQIGMAYEPSALHIANSIWTDQSVSVTDDYNQTAKKYYDAEIKALDFKDSETSADSINDWCKEKTKGLISQIVSSNMINPELKSILVNTVYFNAGWRKNWSYSETGKSETFTCADGSKKELSYMSTSDIFRAYENKQAEAFSCPYADGTEFIGILPKDKDSHFSLADLKLENLIKEENQITGYDEIHAKMPKLDFETDMELTDSLREIGLSSLFHNAAFTGISEEALKIDKVIQKTKLTLDEEGTEAAAATAVMMTDLAFALPEKKPKIKEINLDRPFAFLIYDRENDVILFMGKVGNP